MRGRMVILSTRTHLRCHLLAPIGPASRGLTFKPADMSSLQLCLRLLCSTLTLRKHTPYTLLASHVSNQYTNSSPPCHLTSSPSHALHFYPAAPSQQPPTAPQPSRSAQHPRAFRETNKNCLSAFKNNPRVLLARPKALTPMHLQQRPARVCA